MFLFTGACLLKKTGKSYLPFRTNAIPMLRHSSFILALGLFAPAYAQNCAATIPANAQVVNANGQVTATSQNVWICGGLTSTQISGNSNNIFVEENSVVAINGAQNVIHTKAGVFVVLQLPTNTVYKMPTAQISGGTAQTTINNCTSMTFDYSSAPSNGCSLVGIGENDPLVNVELYPNPADDVLNISAGGTATISQVRIADLSGRTVLSRAGAPTMRIDIADLPAGTYLVLIDTDRGDLRRTITKR